MPRSVPRRRARRDPRSACRGTWPKRIAIIDGYFERMAAAVWHKEMLDRARARRASRCSARRAWARCAPPGLAPFGMIGVGAIYIGDLAAPGRNLVARRQRGRRRALAGRRRAIKRGLGRVGEFSVRPRDEGAARARVISARTASALVEPRAVAILSRAVVRNAAGRADGNAAQLPAGEARSRSRPVAEARSQGRRCAPAWVEAARERSHRRDQPKRVARASHVGAAPTDRGKLAMACRSPGQSWSNTGDFAAPRHARFAGGAGHGRIGSALRSLSSDPARCTRCAQAAAPPRPGPRPVPVQARVSLASPTSRIRGWCTLHEAPVAGRPATRYFTMELVEGVSFIDCVRPPASAMGGPKRTRAEDIQTASPLDEPRLRRALVPARRRADRAASRRRSCTRDR